ncbi:hypothetical protein J4H86_04165 [Spiractinospora alimapuensis]|uniref:hypothetical protein n=1 Tax=Spiractinospora alimapuensis TaxID=2820884 RepID=UPI001F3DFD8B|nr:hypothetical protein [Spiractinospora alimapuensis]QVQ53010.1 hypothetical protein J4H86_04165 [Spiractinospora alimapuensis]
MGLWNAVLLSVLVLLVVAGVTAGVAWRRHGRRLRERFGPEYLRLLMESGDRRSTERELAQRLRRHRRLTLRPLTPAQRAEFTREWAQVQEEFVDGPEIAVQRAENLVARIASALGYPCETVEQRLDYLSVEFPGSVGHYRGAQELRGGGGQGPPSTEDHRQALIRYRDFLTQLLESPAQSGDRPSDPPNQPPLANADTP